eukprot:gb/GFBE01044094.1/.p1 GENE.gb/GFBE01044094.1/~~gb/GFBE01044094.1/.p1  ORF type:complete len:174 (+),score=48.12 gb/GFBE01044094.1/:1-522(+)
MAGRNFVLLAAALLAVAWVPSAFVQLGGRHAQGPEAPSRSLRSAGFSAAEQAEVHDSNSFVSVGLGAAFGFLVAMASASAVIDQPIETPGMPNRRSNDPDGYMSYSAGNFREEAGQRYDSPAPAGGKGLLAELGDMSGTKWESKDKLTYKSFKQTDSNDKVALQKARQKNAGN